MEGVVLFADNSVLQNNTFENDLFSKLSHVDALTVLPISTLPNLEEAVKSISTYKALILDWNFESEENSVIEELEGATLPAQTPEFFLDTTDIYSLIYIYSKEDIGVEIKEKLSNRFSGKIQFRIKNNKDIEGEFSLIISDLQEFGDNHRHMELPYLWSQSINQSAQKIFSELENANTFWIKEIRDTAIADGGEPVTEIIDLFSNLLSEELVQNEGLRMLLHQIEGDSFNEVAGNTAKLYQRIYYSRLTEHAPIMTGDIFHFLNNDIWGILITPECEVSKRIASKKHLDFLIFKLSDIDEYLKKTKTFDRIKNAFASLTKDDRKEKLRKIFNNEELSSHILPSFPSQIDIVNQPIFIDFKTAYKTISYDEYTDSRATYKLNGPYIHQLRQRYISFFGKYGVPAIPNSLREYNLN